jgi:DNA-binding NarL/FixJ family response regulator
MNEVTVMIIDRQAFFRSGVRQALSEQVGFRVLEGAPNEEAMDIIEAESPDVVLLDINYPALSGLEMGRKISRRYPNSKVIMLSPNSSDDELFEVIKTGAVAYLNKNTTIEELVSIIRRACLGEYPINDSLITRPTVAEHVLRQDHDVILVGEMRDLETASAVLTIAETGHMILSTGHAPSSPQAVERIIDLFPPHERFLAQTRLASLLVAVLCQVLVPRADGSGRIAAVEIMLANAPVRNLIREGKIYQLPNVIRTHREAGMISLDEALVNLYLKRLITGETLLDFCNDRQEVEKLIGRVEIR